MKKILAILLILTVIFNSGCIAINIDSQHNEEYENSNTPITLTISGIDEYLEINEKQDVKLIVSGTNNEIYVHNGTNILQIILSGIGNNISLPKDNTPKITKSGIDNIITYRKS